MHALILLCTLETTKKYRIEKYVRICMGAEIGRQPAERRPGINVTLKLSSFQGENSAVIDIDYRTFLILRKLCYIRHVALLMM